MTRPNPIEKATESAGAAVDKAADHVERTVDSARAYAHQALDKAETKARTLHEDLKPTIDALSARAQDMAARSKAAATQTTAQAREKLTQVSERTSAYVAEQPLKSMAIAAAAGAAMSWLLGRKRD